MQSNYFILQGTFLVWILMLNCYIMCHYIILDIIFHVNSLCEMCERNGHHAALCYSGAISFSINTTMVRDSVEAQSASAS